MADAQAGYERFEDNYGASLAGVDVLQVLEDDHTRTRVQQAAVLYQAEHLILDEGLLDVTGQARSRNLERRDERLEELLSEVVGPMGLQTVMSEAWWNAYHHREWHVPESEWPQATRATGLWSGAGVTLSGEEPWQRPGDRYEEWYWPDMPGERRDPEHMRALGSEAVRQGVAPDVPVKDRRMHTLLTGLVHGRRLVAETSDLGKLPPAPGLTPPAQERLRRVAPLNRLAVGVLEDAVRPGQLTRERVVADLAPAAATFGIVIKR